MLPNETPKFELPGEIEKILASLSFYYKEHDKPNLQRLLVNSNYYIKEGWGYDNWNGGSYGHAIFFKVPALIYYELFDNLDDIGREICGDANRLVNFQNEYFDEVFFELEDDSSLASWRENSGVLIHSSPGMIVTSEDELHRLWIPGYIRLFLSHKSEYKIQSSQLKDALEFYGVSCFVAHEDIEPTKKWQDEIERALFSMDALLALMTDKFSDSRWTDQEIGVAIGRQIPVIPVRLGMDPYGFIGKYQALSGSEKHAKILAKEVYELLWTKAALVSRLTEGLVSRFEESESFNQANELVKYIDKLKNATPELINRLEKALEKNGQVRNAYDVQANLPRILKRLRS